MSEIKKYKNIPLNDNNLQILFLIPDEKINGPIPKINKILIPSLQSLGCQITTHPWGRRSEKESLFENSLGRLRDIIQIRNVLKEKAFDILFIPSAHDERALFRELMLLFGCQSFPIRKVLLFHGSKVDHLDRPGNFALKLLTRLVLDKSNAQMVLSSEERKEFQKLFPDKLFFVVDNPFIRTEENDYQKARESSYLKHATLHLLFVGRLIKPKGIFDLLESLQIVLKKANCHLSIVGDGPEADNVRRFIDKLGLNDNVMLMGYLQGEELKSAFYGADIFIFPTRWSEGFPTVLAEAMDAGLPIITTKTRGAADHLQEGLNAIFVPPKEPDAISRAVISLIEDPLLRARMGQANREKVKVFTPEKVARHYLDLLEIINNG